MFNKMQKKEKVVWVRVTRIDNKNVTYNIYTYKIGKYSRKHTAS